MIKCHGISFPFNELQFYNTQTIPNGEGTYILTYKEWNELKFKFPDRAICVQVFVENNFL